MQVIPFTDPSFSFFLTRDAPKEQAELWVANKAAVTAKDAPKGFNPNEDTYFVCTDKENKRYTCVLGWNHALLLRKVEDRYVPDRLYCEGHHTGHPAYGSIDEFEELPSSYEMTFPDDTEWTLRHPPELELERVVTYGVSSCSFSVMHTQPDQQYIAISHMSGQPAIPVGHMLNLAAPGKRQQLIASVFPQENELKKFLQNSSLNSSRVKAKLIVRGRLPASGTGDQQYPQLPHNEMGLELRGGKPSLIGTIGLAEDHHYRRLIPLDWAIRLAAFSDERSEQHLLFESAYDSAPTLLGLRQLFASRGHDVSSTAVLSTKKALEEWQLTDRRRTYRIKRLLVDKGVKTHHRFSISVLATNTSTVRNVEFTDDSCRLVDGLERNAPHLIHGLLSTKQILLQQDAVIKVITSGKQWVIRSGEDQIVIDRRADLVVPAVKTSTQYFCETEADDIVTDVIEPLLAGDQGFADLHKKVHAQFTQQMKTRPYRVMSLLSTNLVQHFEYEVTNGVDWSNRGQALSAYARMLGHFLNADSTGHLYAGSVMSAVAWFRFQIDAPLASL